MKQSADKERQRSFSWPAVALEEPSPMSAGESAWKFKFPPGHILTMWPGGWRIATAYEARNSKRPARPNGQFWGQRRKRPAGALSRLRWGRATWRDRIIGYDAVRTD